MSNHPYERLAALTHYVIARTPPDQLGATKLNKILWWIDCAAYRRWGGSLTGLESYLRLQNGPVPMNGREAIDLLKNRGAIVEQSAPTPAGNRREFYSLAEPPVTEFTAEQIDLINQMINSVCRMTAAAASDASHDVLWEETPQFAQMPISAGSVVVRETRPDDLVWAKRELARLSL